MFDRLRNFFRRSSPDSEIVVEETYPGTSREIILPIRQPVHQNNAQIFAPQYSSALHNMPLPTTGIRHSQVPPLQLNRSVNQEITSRSSIPTENPLPNTDRPDQSNSSSIRFGHRNRRTDPFTQKQIARMVARDTKLINEFAILTSGTAILAYNAASVPGFTLDPCMIQSAATLLGGLFFLYYIHISDVRYRRYLDNRLVKIGLFCITLSLTSILINVITAALNYNSRFWVIGASTSICVVNNSPNATSTTNSLSIRNHNNALFVLCYMFCLFIALLPFLRLLVTVLDSWSTSNQHQDQQEASQRENQRLHALQREAFELNTRLQLQAENRSEQINALETQLASSRQENRYLREIHAHHCADSRQAALDLAHDHGKCNHVHIPASRERQTTSPEKTNSDSVRTENRALQHRVSFR